MTLVEQALKMQSCILMEDGSIVFTPPEGEPKKIGFLEKTEIIDGVLNVFVTPEDKKAIRFLDIKYVVGDVDSKV